MRHSLCSSSPPLNMIELFNTPCLLISSRDSLKSFSHFEKALAPTSKSPSRLPLCLINLILAQPKPDAGDLRGNVYSIVISTYVINIRTLFSPFLHLRKKKETYYQFLILPSSLLTHYQKWGFGVLG